MCNPLLCRTNILQHHFIDCTKQPAPADASEDQEMGVQFWKIAPAPAVLALVGPSQPEKSGSANRKLRIRILLNLGRPAMGRGLRPDGALW